MIHPDLRALVINQRIECRRHHLYIMNQRTQKRVRENRIIRSAVAADQPVAAVWCGRDCDGVQYRNSIHWIENPGNFAEFRKLIDHHIDHTFEWADGPAAYSIVDEAEAAKLEYHSRDLVTEAYEDGHPHVIYG